MNLIFVIMCKILLECDIYMYYEQMHVHLDGKQHKMKFFNMKNLKILNILYKELILVLFLLKFSQNKHQYIPQVLF